MSDNPKDTEAKMAKTIFISADCWLCVFDLLPALQLGLGIAMISHRFDFYVDEHFKTRKWTLGKIRIHSKNGKNGTKEMEIVNSYYWKALQIPQIQMPRKVIGFERINISYIDRNAIAFLRHFRHLFASRPINLAINTHNDRILALILYNIWPMLNKNIHGLRLSSTFFHRLRKFVPSILNDLPLLRIVKFFADDDDLFAEFPCDDSAAASDGQAVAKWLFTPRPDNVPKVLKCELDTKYRNLASQIEAFKAAFASASSPVNFIVVIWVFHSFFAGFVPFVLTNELTREQLTLKRTHKRDNCLLLLIRSPIARDANKWAKWEEEAIGWNFLDQSNQIDIYL
ncbi:hypothetical protein niasHT_032934 [Heterodera trifolii]|uniref:Uncharacterized protein n=1 Tax=Heterodera trifolii TaxID=157864 RepID=A0ABD2ITT7_9BILA